jgi:aminoglycoside phosphotransferase (APT) family kinase protein
VTDPDAAEATLLAGMARLAGRLRPGQAEGPPVVVSRRDDRLIVRCGEVVLKAHANTADPERLAARLRFAARPALRPVLLAPLELAPAPMPAPAPAPGTYAVRIGAHQVSAWPTGVNLGAQDADDAPWEQAGVLLARLHRVPVGPTDLAELPPATVLRRLTDRVTRLRRHAGHPLVDPVLAAWATLTEPSPLSPPLPALSPPALSGSTLSGSTPPPAAIRAGRPTTVIHGDWHFGQLVALPAAGWRIIDVDDLGLGDPAWDLARPAAWFATGLLPVELWARFLDAYTSCGGPAVTEPDDPWAALDLPARALTVEYAATAVAAYLDASHAGNDHYAEDSRYARQDREAGYAGNDVSAGDDRYVGDDRYAGADVRGVDRPDAALDAGPETGLETGPDEVGLAFVDACARIAGTVGDASRSRLHSGGS